MMWLKKRTIQRLSLYVFIVAVAIIFYRHYVMPSVTPVFVDEAMVAAAHPLAVKEGLRILKQGGNALDAAIAVQMVLNVVEPQSSGIGGGGYLLYYDHVKQELFAYDGRETAPLAIPPNVFLDEAGKVRPFKEVIHGGLPVGTPGLLSMLAMAHKQHGVLQWSRLFDGAIHYAEVGYPLTAHFKKRYQKRPIKAIDITEKQIGDLLTNLPLAHTFRLIAREGVTPFYHGVLADKIVDAVKTPTNTGYLTKQDLVDYRPKVRRPICKQFITYKVCSMPPSTSGGIAVLQILALMEPYLSMIPAPNTSLFIHLFSEATKLAFEDRDRFIGDPQMVEIPQAQLLDSQYLHNRSSKMDPETAKYYGDRIDSDAPDTTHISIIDHYGNAVSFTSSIEYLFGSAVMVEGFLLNNELTDFDATLGKANSVQGGKRPRSSMSPVMVFDADDRLYLVAGSPGGKRIIPYVAQFLLAVLAYEMPLGEAINLPHHTHVGNQLELEQGTNITKQENALVAKGHTVTYKELMSGIHAILVQESGVKGIADPRREGVARGF